MGKQPEHPTAASDRARLRNLGLVAHINAGKTTLSERILYATGRQRVLGEVDDGTATMDYLAEEQRRGISITAAVTRVHWKGCEINLIDTPGHVDFTAEVERSLRVLDGVVVVLDGVRGVESQTETVWRQADRRRVPRLVFVNKMDRAGADFFGALDSMRARLRSVPLPIVVPIRDGSAFVGVHELVHDRAELWAPAEVPPEMGGLRAALIEACAEFDESIFSDFVEDRPVSAARALAALRKGVLRGAIVPVLGGSALLNRGVAQLLDAVCQLLPSPMEAAAARAAVADPAAASETSSVPAASADATAEREPLRALVFKSHVDGEESMSFVRLYAGSLRQGDRVAFGPDGKEFEAGPLWLLHANHREPLQRAFTGDVVGLECEAPLRTGDTLYTPGFPMLLEPVSFPLPVVTAVLEPRTHEDAAAIEAAARALAAEDPTLVIDRDADTGELLVSGMGELHLDVFASRLRACIGERAKLHAPTVAYRQTIQRSARGRGECRRATDPAMISIVEVALSPRAGIGAARVEAERADSGRSEPLLEDLAAWVHAGIAEPYPAIDMVVTLVDVSGEASGHEGAVLDLEALSVARRRAVEAAGPVLLAPLMTFELVCPADALSLILADLRSRGARIESVHGGGSQGEVRGQIPLAPVLGYTTRLRSLSRGLATMTLQPAGHVPVSSRPTRKRATRA